MQGQDPFIDDSVVLIDYGAVGCDEVCDRHSESRQETVDPPVGIEEVREVDAEFGEEGLSLALTI